MHRGRKHKLTVTSLVWTFCPCYCAPTSVTEHAQQELPGWAGLPVGAHSGISFQLKGPECAFVFVEFNL